MGNINYNLLKFDNPHVNDFILEAATLEVKEKITVTLVVKEKITELEKEIQHSKIKVETLQSAMVNQAQYSRRNCLIIHGEAVKSDSKEDTDQTAIKIFSEKLGINMTKSNLDRLHRLRSFTGNRPSLIIVKFLSYNLRNQVFQNRKKLKGSGLVITKALTPQKRACVKRLTELRQQRLVLSNWTLDGRIFYTKPNNLLRKFMLDSLNIHELNSKFVE